MHIDINLLYSFGAVNKRYTKGEIIFREGEQPIFYYQIIDGSARMFNTNDDGKEFTQEIFNQGCSFGEPPLFSDNRYPCTAIAYENCEVIKLSKLLFFELIDTHPELAKGIITLFAKRINARLETVKNLINQKPEFRIAAFLNSHKTNSNFLGKHKLFIPFTRQEIANFTGLRVETVIRTLQKMKEEKKVEIINHKIYY